MFVWWCEKIGDFEDRDTVEDRGGLYCLLGTLY